MTSERHFFSSKDEAEKFRAQVAQSEKDQNLNVEVDAQKKKVADLEGRLNNIRTLSEGLSEEVVSGFQNGIDMLSKQISAEKNILKNLELRQKIASITEGGNLSDQQKRELASILNEPNVGDWLQIDVRKDLVRLIEKGVAPKIEAPIGFQKINSSEQSLDSLSKDDQTLFDLYSERFLARSQADREKIQAEIDNLSGKIKARYPDFDTSLRATELRNAERKRVDLNKQDTAKKEDSDAEGKNNATLTREQLEKLASFSDAVDTEQVDQAAEDFTTKLMESDDLLTDLSEAVSKNDKVKIAEIVAILEANAEDIAKHLNDMVAGDNKDKFQKIWDEMKLAEKITQAKEKLTETEVGSEPKSEQEENVEDSADVAEEGSAENKDEKVTETEPKLDRKTQIFKKITGMFTGVLGAVRWINRNAGGHVEDEVVIKAVTNETVSPTNEVAVETAEQKSERMFNLHSKSLKEISAVIDRLSARKKTAEFNADNINELTFALDSMFVIEKIVNDEKTTLNEEQRQTLKDLIDDIGETKLKSGFDVEYSVLMDALEEDINTEGDLDVTRDARLRWLRGIFSGPIYPESKAGVDENISEPTDEEKVKQALDGVKF